MNRLTKDETLVVVKQLYADYKLPFNHAALRKFLRRFAKQMPDLVLHNTDEELCRRARPNHVRVDVQPTAGTFVTRDDNPSPVYFTDPDENGERHFFQACCDCGLVHLVTQCEDGGVVFVRASEAHAMKVRREALEIDPTLFPLRQEKP